MKSVVVSEFNHEHFDCYKEIEGELIFDDEKLEKRLNPPRCRTTKIRSRTTREQSY